MAKCQIDIPPKLHRRARMVSVERGISLRKLLLLGLEKQVELVKPTARQV